MKIGRFCESFHEICVQARDGNTQIFPIIQTLQSTNFSQIFNLSQLIRRIIDSEGCKTSEIYTVRECVSSELDELRRKYSNLPEFLVNIENEPLCFIF